MKRNMRRLALFMALVMLCTSLNGITLGVSAEEVEPVAEEVVEMLMEEEGVEAVIPEVDLLTEEVILPDNLAEEAVILDEEVLLVEEIEELDVSVGELPTESNMTEADMSEADAPGEDTTDADEIEIVESFLMEDEAVVEEIGEDLLSGEALTEKKLTDITVKNVYNYNKSYIKETGTTFEVYFATLQLTYDDATTDSVSISSRDASAVDKQGNIIESIWYKDGVLYTGSKHRFEPGKYVAEFSCGEIKAAKQISFSVFSMYDSDFVQDVLVGEERAVKCSDGSIVVKFKSSAAGTYAIQTNEDINTLNVVDANLNSSFGIRRDTNKYYFSLQADKEYYCHIRPDNENTPSVRLLIESQPRITKMEVVTIPGIYYAGETALNYTFQIKLTYDNKRTAVVNNDSYDSYGNWIRCYLLTADNKQDYDSFFNLEMDAGTYEFCPVIYSEATSTEAYKPETVVPAKVTLTLPDKDNLPQLTLNTYERLSTGGMEKWYAFTAPKDGTYVCQEESAESAYITFYKVAENRIHVQSNSISMLVGETCYVNVYTYRAAKFRMIDADAPMDADIPGEELPETLKLDQLYRVVVYGTPSVVSAAFTPTETGLYSIESSNIFSADPMVYLYDADSGASLGSDDDAGIEKNFKLVCYLQAGQTYQYQMKTARSYTGGFSVILRKESDKLKTVQKIELITDTTEMSELENHLLYDYLHIRLTYTDGSSKVFSVDAAIDEEYNRFSYNIEQKAETETKLQYELTVTWYNSMTESKEDAKTVQIPFTVKKLNDLSAFPLNQPISISGIHDVRYHYQFIPKESGEYILSAKCSSDSSTRVDIFGLGESNPDTLWDDLDGAGRQRYAYHLKAGSTYTISVRLSGSGDMQKCTAEYLLTRGNEVESVTIIKKPNQQTVVPGTRVLSLTGMEAMITYQNGTSEIVAYGSADSSGKTFRTIQSWIDEQTFGVTVRFGSCMTYFTLPASTNELSNLTVLQENVRTDFRGFATFTPERTAAYNVSLQYSAAVSLNASFSFYDGNRNKISSSFNLYWLEQGQTYLVTYDDPDITVSALITEKSNCKLQTVSQIDPTCTTSGELKEYCTWHDDYHVTVYPAAGHTEETIPGKAATCTQTGLTEIKKCSVCNTITVPQQVIAANGHKEITIAGKAATCTETGLTEGKKCSVCNTVTVPQKVIAANGHQEITIAGKAATCTKTGLTEGKKCSACNTVTVPQKVIAANGHKEITIAGKSATCTKTGLTKGKKCSVCNTVTDAQTKIKAKGHTWGKWKAKKATALADGSKTRQCSVCKKKETVKTAKKLKATIKLTASKITLKTKQSTKAFKVTGLAKGDSIVSMKVNKNKSVKISSVNLKKGTCKLTALSKAGKAKLVIKLASGLKKTVNITVQKSTVKATSIKVESKKVTLKKSQKMTLKPEVLPFTCTEKVTYKTSNKRIVTVSKKGVLKGIKPGKAKITIKAGKKKTTVTVTVKKK